MSLFTHLKKSIRPVGVITMILALNGCNPDVFVDRLILSSELLSLHGDGETSVVNLSSDEWMVSRIELDIPEYNRLPCKLYNEAGELVSAYEPVGYTYLSGLGKITFEDKYVDFTIKRSVGKQLEISVGENLRDSEFQFKVELHNGYQAIPISITQPPGSGYVIDSVAYTLKPQSHSIYLEEKETININNNSTEPIPYTVHVFSRVNHKVYFTSTDPKLFFYLKENDKRVPYPEKVTDNGLEMSDRKVDLSPRVQTISLPFPDATKTVNLRVGRNKISVYLEYEEYEADFYLHMSNKKTGNQKCTRGVFHSKMPTGDFLVFIHKPETE
ncbi:MAG: hypothetical protein RR608_09865 [Bacteroidales bacterium]